MSTAFDVQDALRTVLVADAALTAWLQSTFGRGLTVLLGNRKNKQVVNKKFPLVSIIFDPQAVDNTQVSQTAHLIEHYFLDLGLHYVKTSEIDDAHLQHIAKFEELVAQAVSQDRRLGGLVISTLIQDRKSDGNVNHPYHFFTITLRIERSAAF